MSTYEKVVIVAQRFIAVLWFAYSLMTMVLLLPNGANMFRFEAAGFAVLGMVFAAVLYFAAPLLAKIITAGID